MSPHSPGHCYRIHHYPATLIETRERGRTGPLTLRPILPQDNGLLAELMNGLTPLARRNRFHGAVALSSAHLQQMSCVDYQRHLALVVTALVDGEERLIADARYVVEPGGTGAEFALVVADRWQRQGVGAWAMQTLQHAAHRAGLEWLHGEVMQTNAPMLGLMQRCGFALTADAEDEQIVKAQYRLDVPPPCRPRARGNLRSWLHQVWPGHARAAVLWGHS